MLSLGHAARQLLAADRAITVRIVQLAQRRPILRWLSMGLAHAGDGALCAALVITTWFLWPGQQMLCLKIALAMALAALLVMVIKVTVRRPRPAGAVSIAWTSLPHYDVHSFPSGHAARVVCIAVALMGTYPATIAWAPVWAAAVSLARVAVGAHYAGDVLAGMVLGLLVAHITPYTYLWLNHLLQGI